MKRKRKKRGRIAPKNMEVTRTNKVRKAGGVNLIEELHIETYSEDPHYQEPPTQVHINLELIGGETFAMRFKGPDTLGWLIEELIAYRKHVWPDAEGINPDPTVDFQKPSEPLKLEEIFIAPDGHYRCTSCNRVAFEMSNGDIMVCMDEDIEAIEKERLPEGFDAVQLPQGRMSRLCRYLSFLKIMEYKMATWLDCSYCSKGFLVSDAVVSNWDRREPHTICCGECDPPELYDGVSGNDLERVHQYKKLGCYVRGKYLYRCESCKGHALLDTDMPESAIICESCERAGVMECWECGDITTSGIDWCDACQRRDQAYEPWMFDGSQDDDYLEAAGNE